ncbi:MAG: hypothetical protein LLF76_06555 [Planctomycetaceae bacterium]|nr:hypothetical protein [Planctomycetaceae bacterium]
MHIRTGVAAVFLATVVFCGCQRSVKTEPEPAVTEGQSQPAQSAEKPAPAKPKPPSNEYKTSWQENCSVERAFAAGAKVLEDLGLRQEARQTRMVQTRDPRTGRTIAQRVPVSERGGASDSLSAFLEANTTGDIQFKVRMLLMPPESTEITIAATSISQPQDVLKKQSDHLKQKISEAIGQQPLQEEPVPYPQSMIFDCGTSQVYDALYKWADKKGFNRNNGGGGDQYYKTFACNSASNIQFQFSMRLIDVNKTKLEISIFNYENKDEFKLVLADLLKSLEALKTVNTQPQAASEPKPYPEELLINYTVGDVAQALGNWIDKMRFQEKQSSGDQFVRTVTCVTASKIRFTFRMNLVESNQTKLRIWIRDYAEKEDFPMILRSLQEVLKTWEEGNKTVEAVS